MQNECVVCGGGIRPGYTAPEAACSCKKKQNDRDEKKHEMLLAESRWLVACGWEPVDIKTKKEGFLWKDPFGRGDYVQHLAVEMQKKNDADPQQQRITDTQVRLSKMQAEVERRKKAGQSTADIQADMHRVMNSLSQRQAGT